LTGLLELFIIETSRQFCHNFPKGNKMTRFDIQEHLNALREARDEAFSEGDWERVDFIGNCIDDTEKQLNGLSS